LVVTPPFHRSCVLFRQFIRFLHPTSDTGSAHVPVALLHLDNLFYKAQLRPTTSALAFRSLVSHRAYRVHGPPDHLSSKFPLNSRKSKTQPRNRRENHERGDRQ
jgi:hypothetical protein